MWIQIFEVKKEKKTKMYIFKCSLLFQEGCQRRQEKKKKEEAGNQLEDTQEPFLFLCCRIPSGISHPEREAEKK